MSTGKGNPIVEEIGGKIYVLYTRPRCNPRLPLPDYLEVFDEFRKAWTTLPDPPCVNGYCMSPDTLPTPQRWIHEHILLGKRLFVYGGRASGDCFDAEAGKWLQKGSDMPPSFDLFMAGRCVCFQDPLYYYNPLDLHYYVAVAIKPEPRLLNRHGFLLACLFLPEMFGDVLPIRCMSSLTGALVRLPGSSNGKFRVCAVLYGPEQRGPHTLLAVSIFGLREVRGYDTFLDFYNDNCNPKRKPYSELEDLDFVEMEVEKKFSCAVPLQTSNFSTSAFFL